MVYKLSFPKPESLSKPHEILAFVLPLSHNTHHYAIISPFSERELLKNAATHQVVFEGYEPVLPQIKEQVISHLQQKVQRALQLTRNDRKLQRYASMAGIVATFLFVFTSFLDDLILDPLFLSIIGYTFHQAWREKRVVSQLKSGIDHIEFRVNPLLNAISTVFQRLDEKDFSFPDWEEIASTMPQYRLHQTLAIIEELIQFHSIDSLKNRWAHLEVLCQDAAFPMTWVYRLKQWRLQRQIRRIEGEIVQEWELKPSYREVYTLVLSTLLR